MRRSVLSFVLLAPLALLVSSDASAGPPANEFQILTGFSAKETCSCAFVVGQTDAYCNAFGQQAGYAVTITIDHAAMAVTSTYKTSTRTAHFTAGAGCLLDGL